MKSSLIICTFNWPDALNLVLKSVYIQSELPDEIIIADDGSDESTKKVIESFSQTSSIPVIHSWQKDLGCRIPHSRNRAIARTSFEYIIVVDGDTILHKDFIKNHKRYAKHGVYIQGSRVLLQPEFTYMLFKENSFIKPSFFLNQAKNKLNMIYFPFLSFLLSFFKSKNLNRIRGCNFSIYKKDIIRVNGFNEEIITWGREDSEFVQRLFNSGVCKQHLKFSGIQYHLFHKEGVHNIENNNILKEAIDNNLIRCRIGIDRYF